MLPTCSLDIVDVYSPLEQSWTREDATQGDGQTTDMIVSQRHLQPRVSIDDNFFFLCTSYRVHGIVVNFIRKVPLRLRLAVELFLLGSVMVQLCLLVMLHSLSLPTPTSLPTSGIAMHLTEILNSTSTPLDLIRLQMDVPLPQFCIAVDPDMLFGLPRELCHASYVSSVTCEFASEQALLSLPIGARERAYGHAGTDEEAAMSVQMEPFAPNSTVLMIMHRLPGVAASLLSRQIVAAMVKGPLQNEARMRDASNSTILDQSAKALQALSQDSFIANESQQNLSGNHTQSFGSKSLENTWPLFANWVHGAIGDTGFRSSALAYVSCQSETSRSIQPLRHAAELLHRCTEWWLFKVVWMLSIGIITCLVGIVSSFTVRTSLVAFFRIWMTLIGNRNSATGTSFMTHLEVLEALVLVFSPVLFFKSVTFVTPHDLRDDVFHVLLCQALAEICAFCTLRTKESRYVFPRAMLMVYFATVYYIFFHPFGFLLHLRCLLHSFQAFLLVVLWTRFEVAVKLPAACPDQLTVEVRLRPSTNAGQPSPLSAQMQQLLLEQGLMLLGDDRSHESAVVMSAVIMRALQTAKPLVAPSSEENALTAEDEEVLDDLEDLAQGGGVTGQVLLDYAQGGDSRCLALAHHLVARLQQPSSKRRSEVLRWLVQQSENDTLWVLNAVANARPHLLAEVALNQSEGTAQRSSVAQQGDSIQSPRPTRMTGSTGSVESAT